jgi:hypothetical protein
MAAQPEGNEGFRLLEEFVCEAIPGPEVPAAAGPGRGINAGVQVVVEVVARAPQPPLSEARAAELRALGNLKLLALIRSSGRTLSAEELRFIHDLAIQRFGQGGPSVTEGAAELSREAMLATLNRIA